MARTSLILLTAIALLAGYYTWYSLVASRYELLCGVSYWSATSAQRASCKDLQSELSEKR